MDLQTTLTKYTYMNIEQFKFVLLQVEGSYHFLLEQMVLLDLQIFDLLPSPEP